jgi:hypothetical protein
MRARLAACIVLVSAALGVGNPAPAAAESDKVSAQVLFDAGVKLMEQGSYAEAIVKLEESYRQEPGEGTQYKLAICYETTGRFASAWAAWKEVADALDRQGDKERASAARKFADNLVPKLVHLQIVVTPEAASTQGIMVVRDGVEVGRAAWHTRIPVDPGNHQIVASAPKKKLWETSVTIQAGGAPVEVRVPALEDAPVPEPPGTGLLPQRIAAIVAGAVGVLGFGLGSGFGGAAIAQWGAVKSSGGCATDESGDIIADRCNDVAIRMGKNAAELATASDINFVIGGAGITAAAVLWFTAKPSAKAPPAAWLVPLVSADRVGVIGGARF